MRHFARKRPFKTFYSLSDILIHYDKVLILQAGPETLEAVLSGIMLHPRTLAHSTRLGESRTGTLPI